MPCFIFWSERQPNNIDHAYFYLMGVRSYRCVHILSDRGDLSNLIGSLSRTIQQYSPPSEWIMFELGVFPIFVENDRLKVDKILGLTFFLGKKILGRIQYGVFQFTVAEFCARLIVYNSRVFA